MTRSSPRLAVLLLAPLLLAVGTAPAVQAQAVPAVGEAPDPGHGDGDCLRCHEPIRAKTELPVPHAPAAEGDCALCHAPHAARYPKLLNLRERALCGVCHGDKIGEFLRGSVHTPIKAGQCTSCHEVHGSSHAGLLVREGTELCLGCHEERRREATLPVVHPPFTEGECLDCHAAHNSPFPAQLVAPSPNLCQLCHPSTAPELVEAHSGIPVEGTSCTGCHAPHASTSKGLLRPVVHAPFGDASCEMCHLLDSDTPRLVRLTGGRLCALCHKDYPRPTDTVVHKPVADGECASCHVPHTGDIKGLLAGPPETLCTSCHADLTKRAAEAKSAHPWPADKGACLACHAPHSSTEPHLLVNGEIRTCLACHETAKHGHPLGEDRIDPRNDQPITCVTCHDPHGTAFSYQLRGDQSRGLCVQCHSGDHDAGKGKGGRGG